MTGDVFLHYPASDMGIRRRQPVVTRMAPTRQLTNLGKSKPITPIGPFSPWGITCYNNAHLNVTEGRSP